MGLKGKIQILFVVIFAFASLLMSLSLYVVITPELYNRNVTTLENNARLMRTLVDEFIRSTIRDHLVTTADQARKTAEYYYGLYQRGDIAEEEAYARFKAILLDPDYGKIGESGYLAGVNMRGVLEIHPISEGVDASSRDFIKQAIALKNGYLEYEWANVGEDKPRLKVGAVAYFAPWDLLVWASAYRSEFIDLVDQKSLDGMINQVSVGKNGYSFVLSGDGALVSHQTLAGEKVAELRDRGGRAYFQDMIRSAKEQPDAVHTMLYPGEANPGGDPRARIAVYAYYRPLDWIIVSSIPYNEITSILRHMLLIIVLLTAGFFIVVNVVVNLVFSRVLRPVKTMEEVTKTVSSGDLTRRVAVETRDEIGKMSEQFNLIICNFEDLLRSVKETLAVLGTAVQDLSVSSQEIASTSNEQAASVKEIVSTMEDSDQLSRSIASKIGEVATVSANTKDLVQNGFSVIQASLEKMGEIREANTETIAGIENLGEKIESIWEIVKIIDGITDQTKIIAFNAELEAVAAGDAGKNFQIVASEIRRLADSTVNSTGEIKERIREIQNSSDKLIIASEEGTSKIKAGHAQSNTLRELFEDILSSSEISATSAGQIAASIRQQVVAFEQILLTLKQISEGINNFVVSTRSTSQAAVSIRTQSEKLNEIIGKFKVQGEAHDGQR
jgi:methyl-accepting chemotaxis protein